MLSAFLLSACVAPPVREPAGASLTNAYQAMTTAMSIGADDYAHDDLELARSRYALGIAQYNKDPEAAQRYAEQSHVLADLAQAKTEAAKAEDARKEVEAQVKDIEALAAPPPSTLPPAHHRNRSRK